MPSVPCSLSRKPRSAEASKSRCRVLRSVNRAVIVVVSPVAGLLADQLGLHQVLAAAAAIFGASALMLVLSPFRRARGY